MTDTSLRRAGLILIAAAVFAKIVGFVREAVIAGTYGTSHTVDVYLAGMTLPAMAATIVFHSIPNAFVPLFSEAGRAANVRRQAWGVLGVMCLISACMWFLAGRVASLTSIGFSSNLRSETIVVLRITSLAVALATIEAVVASQADKPAYCRVIAKIIASGYYDIDRRSDLAPALKRVFGKE